MPNETTYSGILGDVLRFHAALATAVAAIPHLEAGRVRLGEALSRAQDLAQQQAAVTAAKQELSLQLKSAIRDMQLLATVMRKGIRQHFGTKSEKLTEFGLQPFRSRQSDSNPAPTPETEPALPTP